MTPSTVIGRLLIALGISLIIGSLVGTALATTSGLEMQGSTLLEPNHSLVLAVYSMSSNGTAVIHVENASSVFYVANIVGDPRVLLRALTAFNINTTATNFKHDLRLGIVYGTALVKANSKVLGALPSLSTILKFNIKEAKPSSKGVYDLSINVKPGEAFLVFIINAENKPKLVNYTLTYSVSGASRLAPLTISLIGLASTVIGVVLYRSLRPVTLLGERILAELREDLRRAGRIGRRARKRIKREE